MGFGFLLASFSGSVTFFSSVFCFRWVFVYRLVGQGFGEQLLFFYCFLECTLEIWDGSAQMLLKHVENGKGEMGLGFLCSGVSRKEIAQRNLSINLGFIRIQSYFRLTLSLNKKLRMSTVAQVGHSALPERMIQFLFFDVLYIYIYVFQNQHAFFIHMVYYIFLNY